MSTSQFYLRLSHGIQGGIVAPDPLVFTLTSDPSTNTLLVQEFDRPSAKKENPVDKPIKSKDSHSKVDKLIAELEKLLSEIPREDPPGSADIYGFNTGIMFGSDKVEWANQGPQGCGGGYSEVEPTEEEKKKFKRAVDIAEELVKLGEAQEITA